MMKVNIILAAFIFIAHNDGKCSTRTSSSKNFDVLKAQLKGHTWSENQKECSEKILKTIHNVENKTLWASWIWDSIQLPVGQLYGSRYHLGNYNQCLKEKIGNSEPPFRTQYCLADIILGSDKESNLALEDINPYVSTEDYITTKTKLKQSLNVITWGVCLPDSCQNNSTKTFLRTLLKHSHLGHLQNTVDITVTHCERAGETKNHIDGFYIVLFAALAMSTLVLVCTKFVSGQCERNSDRFIVDVMKCFCLKRNMREWLQRPRNDIQVLHGIRFFSSCLIVLLHIFFVPIALGNSLDFEESLESYEILIKFLLMVVETFFVISGLLYIKNTKPIRTVWDFVYLVIKRYFRLMWWYFATALVMLVVLPRTGCGPLCARVMSQEYENCRQSWIAGLMMLENYISYAKGCNPVAWYIFCDFHLSVVATTLLWLQQKNVRAALICFFIISVLSILLPATVIYNTPEVINFGINFEAYKIFRVNERTVAVDLYLNTHHRASPYLVGLMMGYLMSNYGAKAIRRTIAKKQFVISLLSFLSSGMFLYIYLNENFKAAVLVMSVRLTWSFMICALIFVCEYGSLPYIKDLLSWYIFVPLGKLMYGVYMVHTLTIAYSWYSSRNIPYFNGYLLTEKYLGNLILCCFLSLYFLLFVEAPLNNFIKLLFSSSTKVDINKHDRVVIKLNGEAMSETQYEVLSEKMILIESNNKHKIS